MSAKAASYVLDSYALLALLEDEPSAERVSEAVADSATTKYMSVVNFGEVLYVLERRRSAKASREVRQAFEDSPEITLVEVTVERAAMAAVLKARGGMAFADCFAAALAEETNGTVLTGDPEFAQVEGEVNIEWLTGKKP